MVATQRDVAKFLLGWLLCAVPGFWAHQGSQSEACLEDNQPFKAPHFYTKLPLQWSLVLPGIAIAALTDWLDGVAARKLNQHSVLGSYLDPIADKILIGSVTLGLAQAVRALRECWLLVVTE